jgi:hypothetical protein
MTVLKKGDFLNGERSDQVRSPAGEKIVKPIRTSKGDK